MSKKTKDTHNYQHPSEPHFWCEIRGFITDVNCRQCYNNNKLVGDRDHPPQMRPYCQQLQRELEYRRGEGGVGK